VVADLFIARRTQLDPPPPVKFEEFDGLTRILFSRKNKVVRSNFQAKGVESMLESNYKALKAEQGEMLDGDFDISVLLAKVLDESGFAEFRASKMDVDDFLK